MSQAWLVMENDTTRSFPLQPYQTSIGRQTDNDVILTDPSVSRHHALIRREGTIYILFNRSVHAALKVNGNPVTGSQMLYKDDLIQIGNLLMRFVSSG